MPIPHRTDGLEQLTRGFPRKFAGQLHCTPWFTTRQIAHVPQTEPSSQGSGMTDSKLISRITDNKNGKECILEHKLSTIYTVFLL